VLNSFKMYQALGSACRLSGSVLSLETLFLFFRTDYMIPQTFTVTSNISAYLLTYFTFQFYNF